MNKVVVAEVGVLGYREIKIETLNLSGHMTSLA